MLFENVCGMRLSLLKGLIRGALRDRLLTGINIGGMALGLAAGFLILAFSLQEYTRDQYYPDSDRLYRVDAQITQDGESSHWADTPPRLGEELSAGFAGVEASSTLLPGFGVVRFGGTVEYELLSYVTPAFPQMFGLDVLEGTSEGMLTAPDVVVLPKRLADRYFPSRSAVGELISIKIGDTFRDMRVEAVVDDPAEWSSIPFGVLVPLEAARGTSIPDDWFSRWLGQTATFVRLERGSDPETVNAALDGLQDLYGEELLQGRDNVSFFLTPVADMYFITGAQTRGIVRSGSRDRADILLALAVLIMVIASANFTTLALARSERQTKAVGIRKAVGASRGDVAREFLLDALMKTAVAAVLALVLADVLSGRFGELVGQTVRIELLYTPLFAGLLMALVVVVGVLSGAFPSFHLSRIRPIGVLKGSGTRHGRGWLTKGLVVVQFAATAVLIASTWIMSRQLEHLDTIDPGLDPGRVLVIGPDFTSGATVPAVAARLATHVSPAIEQMGRSSGMLSRSFRSVEVSTGTAPERIPTISVTESFLDMLEIETITGRWDGQGALINGPLADELQLDGLVMGASLNDDVLISGQTNDFYYRSRSQPPGPFALLPLPADAMGGYLLVKHAPGMETEALDAVQTAWRAVAPDVPMDSYRLADDLSDQSGTARSWSRVVRAASIFAILIACLGLFGLSTLAGIRRTKEMGVRKILGANTLRLTALMVQETAALVAVACLVGIPVSWFVMQRWLDGFGNRLDPGWGVYAGLIVGLLGIAVATVSVQSVRFARRNPVESLRHE